MQSTELQNLLARIDERERVARRRAWLYVAIPLLVGIGLLLFSSLGVYRLEKRRTELTNEKTKLESEIGALTTQVNIAKRDYTPGFTEGGFTDERKAQILDSISHDPKRRQALELAFQYEQQRIPFKFGGKSPEEGFDTSGYVSYVLSQQGIIKNPETYYSSRLRYCFAQRSDYGKKEVPGMQAGDLIFYEPTTPVFYLDERYCLGMVPKGIYVMETSTLEGLTFRTFAKVDYNRVATCPQS